MEGHTVKRFDEMEATYGGAMRRARAELGVEAFGLSVIDLPAGFDGYTEHTEEESGQEEVYVTLAGTGEIEVGGQRHAIDTETVARVAPESPRKIWPGPEGIRILAIGGVPGGPYVPSDVSKLGAPDPFDSPQP